MNERDYMSDLERTIKNVVNDIRESRDYQSIKRSASDFGSRVIDEVTSGIRSAQDIANAQAEKQREQNRRVQRAYTPRYSININTASVRNLPAQSVSGILMTIFGSILTAMFSIAAFVMLLVWIFDPSAVLGTVFAFMALADAGGIAMLSSGIKRTKQIGRFNKYYAKIRGREFIQIEELSKTALCKPETVRSDLGLMSVRQYIDKPIFDQKNEYAFFNDEVYSQYLESCKKQELEKEEEQRRTGAKQNSRIIKDGWQYLKEIEDTALDIECTSIRQKTLALCETANKIMEFVTDNPEKSDEIKKFSSYYLPSTANILKTFASFENHGIDNSDIQKTKAEIEDMLDVSAPAFKKVLDSLYDDDVMDVSTDIAAMQAMMAQEGLIDSFEITKNKDGNEGGYKLMNNENITPKTDAIILEATPVLTTDPFAEAAPAPAVVVKEEEKTALDDSMLSESEKQMVSDFVGKIQLTDSNTIMLYGSGAQKKIADFSQNALDNIRTKDLGEVGDLLSGVVNQLRDFEVDNDSKGFFGLFKKNKAASWMTKYNKVENNIDQITESLETHQVKLLKDIATLDKMYELNKVYFKELTMYIIAGKRKLDDVRANELAQLTAKAQQTGLAEDAQAANDLAGLCDRFEKKLHDLELTRMVSIQMAPQIRMVQGNNTLMSEKIQSTIVNTIPLWKSQIVLALGIEDSRRAAAAQREVTDMTNEPLKKNAQTLKMATIETAKESERGIVDLETVKSTNEALISTLDEVIRIQDEGRQKRRDAEAELGRMETELKQKLLDIRS